VSDSNLPERDPSAPTPVDELTEVSDEITAVSETEDQSLAPVPEDQAEPEGLGPIEAGIAGLFVSFEKGVLNLLDDKPKDGQEPGAVEARQPPKPREVPHGRTYDEALSPIRWKSVIIGLMVLAGILAAYFALNYGLVRAAADDDETRPADVIVVLGAAQFDGTPSPVFANRLDHAFGLWDDDLADLIVTTGANQEGDRFTEGFSGYLYLRDKGVPDEDIITVVDGTDTWEQMTATANQIAERGLASALLVSDGYHNYRLRQIASEAGVEAWVSPTDLAHSDGEYVREAVAVSIGRVIGYRRLSAFGDDEAS